MTCLGKLYSIHEDSGKSTLASEKDDKSFVKLILPLSWTNFCLFMGVMAGFETVLSLSVNSAYGWGSKENFKAWAGFGFVSIFAFASAPLINFEFNRATVIFGCQFMSLLSLVGVNWTDLSKPVSILSFYISMLGAFPCILLSVTLQSLLVADLPAHLQVAGNTFFQFAGQVGRGFGPIVVSLWYNWYVERMGKHSGLNSSNIYLVACFFAGRFAHCLQYIRLGMVKPECVLSPLRKQNPRHLY